MGAQILAPTMFHRPRKPGRASLEYCPACGADFVNPVEWDAVEDHSWWMRLRCAQCEHEREVVVGNEEAERFDEALDRRADPIARAVHRLDVDGMRAWVDSVTVALQRDLIGPADFAR